MTVKLSMLDQSLARSQHHTQEAFQETIKMAQLAEQLGYERFWVSEHHAFHSVAGSVPEVLLSAVGAATQSIRLGSGGVMLPHYSAYKVAEVFAVLANLYPGRMEVGVGRAPGSDMATAMALATDGRPKFERFPELVSKLSEYLWEEKTRPILSPKPPEDLPIWLLGSSGDSAQLAAQRGMPYSLALFINHQASPALMHYYQQHFQPSEHCATPYGILTLSVNCAETEERAAMLEKTHDINVYRFITGQSKGVFISPEDAQLFPTNPDFEAFRKSRMNSRATGTPEQVKEKLLNLKERYNADEIMAVTNMYYFEDRKRCFELLKEAFA